MRRWPGRIRRDATNSGGDAMRSSIVLPPASLPVLYDVDVAVVGGSIGGVAAALACRRAGLDVVAVESRTYLGREITALLRPWVGVRVHTPLWTTLLERLDLAPTVEDFPLPIDRLKVVLEDLLLEAGVRLLYATQTVAVLTGDDGIAGAVIANKSGRQIVVAPHVIDATEAALVARLAGGEFHDVPGSGRFSRTLEFDRVGELDAPFLDVPPDIGAAESRVHFYSGYRPGQVFVLVWIDTPSGSDPRADMDREIRAREVSLALAAHLTEHVPGFREATVGFGAFELAGRRVGQLPRYAGSPFAGPIEGLWVLNQAMRHPSVSDRPTGVDILGDELGKQIAGMPRRRGRWHEDVEAETPPSSLHVREPQSPQPGRSYVRRTVPPMEIPVFSETEVLVVGGGTSGATAAITAAEAGASTALVEMNPGLGGTGTIGGVHSYWYGRHVGFSARVQRMTDEVHATIGHSKPTWNIEAKMFALLRATQTAGVDLLWRSITFGTVMEGDAVRGVVVATPWGPRALLAGVTIDATGDGDVAAFAGAPVVYGAEGDFTTMWYSLAQFSTPGRTRNNFTSAVDVSNVEDYTRAILSGRRRGSEVHDHGVYVAPRESRHVLGEVVLTHTDQLTRRHWPDVINIHYSNHDVKGPSTSPWVRVGLIPPNLEIGVPYRAIIPRGLDGLIVAGKAISADHDALAAIRMQADMENLGGVAALAAVAAVRDGVRPRDVDVPALQHELVARGLLAESDLAALPDEGDLDDDALAALVAGIDGAQPLHAYSDMEMGEVFEGRIPFVDVCTAGERIVPHLEAALRGADGLCRVHLAQALAFYRSPTAVPALVAAIDDVLSGGELPARDNQIRHANYPPDQGAMPDVVYLLYSLGMTADPRALPVFERVAALLRVTEEGIRDRRTGTFYYVEAVAWGLEQLASPAALPALRTLHAAPALHDQVLMRGFQADLFAEREAFLELCLARAIARCGGEDGLHILIGYLRDVRSLLARRAHADLVASTGEDVGLDPRAWERVVKERQTVRAS
jgi:flavin-dependent dehydrogenase